MMGRLVVDDLVHWATTFKVDGFRFDCMGHIMLETVMEARDRLNQLTEYADGVNGKSILMYGEGWDFGEVVGNARGVNAVQANLSNSTVGSFNDRFRDAAAPVLGHAQVLAELPGERRARHRPNHPRPRVCPRRRIRRFGLPPYSPQPRRGSSA